MTIVPNFLITAILAVLVDLASPAWSVAYVHKKHAAPVLMVLTIILWLFGGGFASHIFLGVPARLVAPRIGKPLSFWRRILPEVLRGLLSRIWLGRLAAFVLCFVLSVAIIITWWPLTAFLDAGVALETLNAFAYRYLGFMVLSLVEAFAHDIQLHDLEVASRD